MMSRKYPALQGYAAVWGKPYRRAAGMRALAPHCFGTAPPRVDFLIEHDEERCIATVAEIMSDSYGLCFRVELPRSLLAAEAFRRVAYGEPHGASAGLSFADADAEIVERYSVPVQVIRKARLDEISLTPRPGMRGTFVELDDDVDVAPALAIISASGELERRAREFEIARQRAALVLLRAEVAA